MSTNTPKAETQSEDSTPAPTNRCKGGEEVGVDWIAGQIIHSEDEAWHAWDTDTYGTPGF